VIRFVLTNSSTVVNGNKDATLLSKYMVDDSEDKCCLVRIRTD